MHWLLTRPAGANDFLRAALERLGASVSEMPALEIVRWQDADEQPLWQQLSHFELLLFTSANAVCCFAEALQEKQLQWPQADYLAIGAASAECLATYQQQAFFPSDGNNSEAFLSLPQLAAWHGRRLLLVTGRGGRGLLEPSLRDKGIEVARLSVYQRRCAAATAWPQHKVDLLLVTSLESWHCLLQKGLAERDAMRGCRVIAGGERIAAATRKLCTTYVAASPSDEHMLAVIQEIYS